ncbi:MAG TPA: cupin domain-containing protein [Chloroflexota bacterium]|nr:cupin domain-containing protein [Chloroflexota bacterium]
MPDFYEAWLAESKRIQCAVEDAPRVAEAKSLEWVRTRQDARAALMIAPETGFPTGGSALMKAEIPVGWHTGKHLHGEEAIYVEQGRGFLVLDDLRYDFERGTIFHIPFRSTHQLFNTGAERVVYLSGTAWPLEASIHVAHLEQLEEAGPNDGPTPAAVPAAESQYWPVDGRRISMHQEQFERSGETKHGATYFLMGRNGKRNGFNATAVAISSLFVETPHSKSHSHAHPEAYLYALQGQGYSEIGGKRYSWAQGDAVHVPPGMLHHQHFNPTDGETKELRFEFGIRYWMVEQWAGFQTIDRDLKPTRLDE